MKSYVNGLAFAAAVTFLFLGVSFFVNLQSTSLDYSGYGVVWPLQLFHNFVNGRFFQHSLFSSVYGGAAAGFVGNPYAYIHGFAIHVNIFPFLFAPLWSLFPTVTGLYGLLFLWNVGLGFWFTWRILQRISSKDSRSKAIFAMSIFLGGGLLGILNQMAQLLLFAGPLMLAAYDCLVSSRRIGFFMAMVGLCLVTEDAAMVAAAFSLWVYATGKDKRVYGRDGFIFSVSYLLVALFIVQPAARVDLIQTHGTTAATVINCLARLTPHALCQNLWSMLPVIAFLPAFVMAGFIFGWPNSESRKRALALAIIPSSPHWGESLVVGGAHHLAPPFFSLYLALLYWLSSSPGVDQRSSRSFSFKGLVLSTLIFFIIGWRAAASNLPAGWKPMLYRWMGNEQKAVARERSLSFEEESNGAVIRAARTIPPSKSLVYWVNKRVPGFIACRSDVWQFPDFFDQADYLLLQKDAQDLFFKFDADSPRALREVIKEGWLPDERDVPMTEVARNRLIRTLVTEEGTHRVVQDDAHVILLERLSPHTFYQPPQTVGMGWMHALFHKKGAL